MAISAADNLSPAHQFSSAEILSLSMVNSTFNFWKFSRISSSFPAIPPKKIGGISWNKGSTIILSISHTCW
ncbi:hypothetical protein [Dapis sp. BLCC M172]|uniref:hypothetical protein n=1 Tax=Dapis sp. BLCC M172 TaxID=2975281 RepID=UPI003CEFEF5B